MLSHCACVWVQTACCLILCSFWSRQLNTMWHSLKKNHIFIQPLATNICDKILCQAFLKLRGIYSIFISTTSVHVYNMLKVNWRILAKILVEVMQHELRSLGHIIFYTDTICKLSCTFVKCMYGLNNCELSSSVQVSS